PEGQIMAFHFRVPSAHKRAAARVSIPRAMRHSVGLKAPRGAAWITDPNRAAYNRVYHRTTLDPVPLIPRTARTTASSPIGAALHCLNAFAAYLWRLLTASGSRSSANLSGAAQADTQPNVTCELEPAVAQIPYRVHSPRVAQAHMQPNVASEL